MKVFRANITKAKQDMTCADILRDARELARLEINSVYFISLGAVANKVINHCNKHNMEMTFMSAMDLVDEEAQKILKAIKECAVC